MAKSDDKSKISLLTHQVQCLREALLEMTTKKQNAMDMVWSQDQAILARQNAINARDKYIKELEDRLEYYEGNNAGPLSGRH